VRKPIDPKDPFLASVPRYKQLHQTIRTTEELLDKLEPYEGRRNTSRRALKAICDLDRRFNRAKPQKTTNIIVARDHRHQEVRKNPEELRKLDQLHEDLCDSKELLEVPKISD
jgi:hypothetical protein